MHEPSHQLGAHPLDVEPSAPGPRSPLTRQGRRADLGRSSGRAVGHSAVRHQPMSVSAIVVAANAQRPRLLDSNPVDRVARS